MRLSSCLKKMFPLFLPFLTLLLLQGEVEKYGIGYRIGLSFPKPS